MHRFPLPTLSRAAVLAAILIASAAAALVSRAAANEQGSAWSAPAGVDPCGSELALEQQLLRDPALRAKLEAFEVLAREAERAASAVRTPKQGGPSIAATPIYTIPVVVHIVYAGPGDASDISDSQVRSQIDALNRDFTNLLNHGAPAVDTQIQFCLAQTLPVGSPVMWSTTPGITRTIDIIQTNHIYGSVPSEVAIRVASGATIKLLRVARAQSSEANNSWYQRNDQPGIG